MAVLQIKHASLAILMILLDASALRDTSAVAITSQLKYRSVLNYSVKKGECLKCSILLNGYRRKQLDILLVVDGRNARVLRQFSKNQLLLSNFRASKKSKACCKALTEFFCQA